MNSTKNNGIWKIYLENSSAFWIPSSIVFQQQKIFELYILRNKNEAPVKFLILRNLILIWILPLCGHDNLIMFYTQLCTSIL